MIIIVHKWSIELQACLTWTLPRMGYKNLEASCIWCNDRLERFDYTETRLDMENPEESIEYSKLLEHIQYNYGMPKCD